MFRLLSILAFVLFVTSCKKETDPITESFDSKNLIRRWTLSTIDPIRELLCIRVRQK